MPVGAIISGGIQIGSALYDAAQRRARIRDLMGRRYGTTEIGMELKNISREGALSSADEAAIRSRTSRSTAQSAQDARQAYIRQVVGGGMDPNSIAAARGLSDIENQRSQTLANQETDISLSESQAKSQARLEYARQATSFDLQKQGEIDKLKYGSTTELAGELAGGITQMAEGITDVSLTGQLAKLTDKLEKLEELDAKGELTEEGRREMEKAYSRMTALKERINARKK